MSDQCKCADPIQCPQYNHCQARDAVKNTPDSKLRGQLLFVLIRNSELQNSLIEEGEELATLKARNAELTDQRDVAVADLRIALNELQAIVKWIDGPEMTRYNTSIARMLVRDAKATEATDD